MGSRMRLTKSKTGSRRSQHGVVEPNLSKDPESGAPHPRHRVSPTTGRYRGRVVIDVAAKLEKQEKKRKKRESEAIRSGERVAERDEEEPKTPTEESKVSDR